MRSPARAKGDLFRPPATTSRQSFLQNGSDQGFREAIYIMVMALDGLLKCRDIFGKELGLTGSQFAVLIGTAYRQGAEGVTVRDLAEHVRLAAPHVTTEVGRLIRLGLLTKCPHSSDRRSVLVSLTPAGEEAVLRVSPLVRQVNDILFDTISAEDLTHVVNVMRTLALNAERVFAQMRLGELTKKS
ncbi:MarR family winged helix-turn-helix transcriptional regulator [Pseudochelatococcus sp. B33]